MHGYVLDLIVAFKILLRWNDIHITNALSISCSKLFDFSSCYIRKRLVSLNIYRINIEETCGCYSTRSVVVPVSNIVLLPLFFL